jgi:hypothetical protein
VKVDALVAAASDEVRAQLPQELLECGGALQVESS